MSAMYLSEAGLPGVAQKTEAEREKRLREPIHPQAARFLQHLAAGRTKTLLTTRGRATVVALHLDKDPDALNVREAWVEVGWHPPDS